MIKSCVCLKLVTMVCEGDARIVQFYVTCNYGTIRHDHGCVS